jgi:CheY-like chemotaxis protein
MQGHVRILIEQVLRNEQDVHLKFSVIDTGIGISAEHIEHIFDEFTQAETSTTRRFGGTGLGLVISKTLVQRMGGELQVNSQLDHGSHFWFEVILTLSDAELACEQELDAALANSRILVLDDNAVSREILVRTLGQYTDSVDEANVEQQVLETIRQAEHNKQAYDVVLIDWRVANLHDQNTAELIMHDSGIKLKPAVVLLTAYGSNDILDTENDAASVYADVLFKPITPLQLKQSLGHCVQKQQRKVEPAPLKTAGPLTGLKLLVVDDNEINRLIAFELLRHEGAEVELAASGIPGVKTVLAALQQFDVVLMDIQMPDIDGYEATRQIRADERFTSLPIIALTANVSQQDIEDCLAAGMNGHIGKPFDMTQVVHNILSALKLAS